MRNLPSRWRPRRTAGPSGKRARSSAAGRTTASNGTPGGAAAAIQHRARRVEQDEVARLDRRAAACERPRIPCASTASRPRVRPARRSSKITDMSPKYSAPRESAPSLRRPRSRVPAHLSVRAPQRDRELGPLDVHAAQGQRGARGRAGELAALLHRLRTDAASSRRCSTRAERRAARRRSSAPTCARCSATWRNANALPAALVERSRRWRRRAASTRGAPSARRTTGPASPRTCARSCGCARQRGGAARRRRRGLSKYDALMDRFEPGMRSARGRSHVRRREAVAAAASSATCRERQASEHGRSRRRARSRSRRSARCASA